ncbi:MAG: iron ABC transporter permease [Firmicutes bacterium]|nr:iron ABC transporter permease [Bacillota bacterium]
MGRSSDKLIWALLGTLLLVLMLLGLTLGATVLDWPAVWQAWQTGDTTSTELRILLWSRLPRVLGGVLAGAALAAAGVILQAMLGNPLAGPNVLGVNAGAGFLVLLAAALWPDAGALLPVAAFMGALLAVGILLLLTIRGGASGTALVLLGVALTTIFSAGMDCVLLFWPDAYVGAASFLVGSLAYVTPERLCFAAPYILLGLALAVLLARELNLLSLGVDMASSLGQNVRAVRAALLLVAALLVGAAVSFAGLLSFVGLIVPHIMRFLLGGDNRLLLPASALGGAALVVAADMLARLLFAPYELSVGILLAALGGPFFIYLVIRNRSKVL